MVPPIPRAYPQINETRFNIGEEGERITRRRPADALSTPFISGTISGAMYVGIIPNPIAGIISTAGPKITT